MSCREKLKNLYNPESPSFDDYPVEQTVLLREKYIQTIPFLKQENNKKITDYSELCYPYANSYYNHIEDTDANEKVSALLIQPEILCSPLPPYLDKNESDPYSEQDAQQKYLESSPVSFLILGKPDIGQQELGKKLADYWRCVYIEPQTLIESEIASDSREGQRIEFNLRCGRAVGIDIILKLVQRVSKSSIARHRGFVLCGLPVIPNDFYEEDPVSSESAVFTARDIFEEIVDSVAPTELIEQTSKHQVSVSSKFKTEERVVNEFSSKTNFKFKSEENFFNKSEHTLKEISAPDLRTEGENKLKSSYTLVPESLDASKSLEISLNYENQLENLFSLLQLPFLIIYIQCSSGDVLNKRDNYHFDYLFNRNVDLQRRKYNRIYQDYLKSDKLTGDIFLEEIIDDFSFQDDFKLKDLVLTPKDFKVNVSSQLDKYHQAAVEFIEARVLSHNPEYFVKVDGRTSIARMFEIIKGKLKILPLQKVVIPEKIYEIGDKLQPQSAGENAEKINLNPEEESKIICSTNVHSNFFQWSLSDWGLLCPVALKLGYKVQGTSKNAVQFMNKVFFLSSDEYCSKFLNNPRPYLLLPNPKPPCKIVIFGPMLSGKSALAQCLAYYYNGLVLNTNQMISSYLRQMQEEYLEKIKQNAIAEGIRELNKIRKIESKELESQRIENIKYWAKHAVELLEMLTALLEEKDAEDKLEVFEISAFPMAMKAKREYEENIDLANRLTSIRAELEEMKIPIPALHISVPQGYLKERRKLLAFLPPHLTKKHIPKPATVFDDFVIKYVQDALDKAGLANMQLGAGSLLDMFLNKIKEAEKRYISQGNGCGGWIIDGMILHLDLLKSFYPHYVGDEIILLKYDENDDFLISKFEKRQSMDFYDYKAFFKSISANDAAWRCPANEDQLCDVEDLVSNILTEILDDDKFYEISSEFSVHPRVEAYINEVSKFYKQWTAIQEFYQDIGIQPIEINITNKEFPEIFKEVIKKIQNRYTVQAILEVNEEQINEEFQTKTEINNKGTTFQATKDDLVIANPDLSKSYGDTYNFCPVTFFEKFVLWRGKNYIAATFNEKRYLFSNENDLNNFLLDPKKYLPPSFIKDIPPPRICIIGISTCGKTSIAKALSKNYGLIYISYESIIKGHFHILGEEKINQIKNNTVKSYLESNDPLPQDFYKTLMKYWFHEPFKSRGFVFDDFPKRKADLDFMVKNKMIPDVVLILEAEEKYTKGKLLDRAIQLWQDSIKKERDEIAWKNENALTVWKEKKVAKFNQMLEKRRQERYTKKLEKIKLSVKKSKSNKISLDSEITLNSKETKSDISESDSDIYSQVSFDSAIDQQDINEIQQLIEETEIPPTIINLPSDDYTEISLLIAPGINELVDKDTIVLKDIKQTCSDQLIPWQNVVLNLDDLEKTIISAFLHVDSIKFRNRSVFEICYDISLELAEKLLNCGYFFLSKFGKTCPVQYFENKNPIQMYILNERNSNNFAVIHRSYIYFIGGSEQRDQFKKDPLKYIEVSFNFPLLQFRVAITGPPKCGKTVLSKRIEQEYGFKRITRGDAIRYVLKYLSQSSLALNMEDVLRKGWELTDEMVIKCFEAASFDKSSVTQGVVLDGFPNTIQEVKQLSYLNLVPNIAINLLASEASILQCLTLDKNSYKLKKYGEKFVLHVHKQWLNEIENFNSWFDKEYQVSKDLPIDPSRWSTWDESSSYLLSTFWEIKHYHQHIKEDWPVRLANMQVTPLEFIRRKSEYKSYCPCCLHYSNILNNGGLPPDRTGLVQFREYFYWICNLHLEEFLKTPELFLPPYNGQKMPSSLPKRVRFNVMPDNVYEEGSCAVCYKQKRIIFKGSLDFQIEYKNKTYLFDCADCFNTFKEQPHLYTFGIEFRAPIYPPLKYRDLPVLGMLEQYVAKYIIQGISYVSKRRPLIPGLSIKASALIGLGLHIKINNENCPHSVRPYYEEGFKLFNKRRDYLLSHLNYMNRVRNPYIHYQEPLPEFKMPPRQKPITGADIIAGVLKTLLDNVETLCENVLNSYY